MNGEETSFLPSPRWPPLGILLTVSLPIDRDPLFNSDILMLASSNLDSDNDPSLIVSP